MTINNKRFEWNLHKMKDLIEQQIHVKLKDNNRNWENVNSKQINENA